MVGSCMVLLPELLGHMEGLHMVLLPVPVPVRNNMMERKLELEHMMVHILHTFVSCYLQSQIFCLLVHFFFLPLLFPVLCG